jgi:hypothetical protein
MSGYPTNRGLGTVSAETSCANCDQYTSERTGNQDSTETREPMSSAALKNIRVAKGTAAV